MCKTSSNTASSSPAEVDSIRLSLVSMSDRAIAVKSTGRSSSKSMKLDEEVVWVLGREEAAEETIEVAEVRALAALVLCSEIGDMALVG